MVADRIKVLREQKGYTQAQLLNVSTDYLLCVERTAVVRVAGLTETDVNLVHNIIIHLKEKNSHPSL